MMRVTFTILLFLSFTVSYSQAEKKYIRKGNKEYNNDKYAEAELDYRKAIDKKPDSRKANYNLGNSLYKQDKFEAARTKYENLAVTESKDKLGRSKYYYNLGNTYFKENKLKESIEAYKNALRYNPGDADAKHNLQFTLNLLANQQNQNQNNSQNENNEPSEFAKRIKEQADELVLQRKYKEAYDLMKEAEKKDKTVLNYSDFTERIHEVVKID